MPPGDRPSRAKLSPSPQCEGWGNSNRSGPTTAQWSNGVFAQGTDGNQPERHPRFSSGLSCTDSAWRRRLCLLVSRGESTVITGLAEPTRTTMRSKAIRFMSIATTAMLLHGVSLYGQETAAERHALAKNHLQRLATEMTARCLDDVRNL